MKALLLAALLGGAISDNAQDYEPKYPTPNKPYGVSTQHGEELDKPFKGANTILIHTTDSISIALRNMAKSLLAAGVEAQNLQTGPRQLSTKAKATGRLAVPAFSYTITASTEPSGTRLAITGAYSVGMSQGGGVINNGMYWSKDVLVQANQCFAAIEPLAHAYPGARISYQRRR